MQNNYKINFTFSGECNSPNSAFLSFREKKEKYTPAPSYSASILTTPCKTNKGMGKKTQTEGMGANRMVKTNVTTNRMSKNTSAVRNRIFISLGLVLFCADFKIPQTPHRNAVAVTPAHRMATSNPKVPSGVTAKRTRHKATYPIKSEGEK